MHRAHTVFHQAANPVELPVRWMCSCSSFSFTEAVPIASMGAVGMGLSDVLFNLKHAAKRFQVTAATDFLLLSGPFHGTFPPGEANCKHLQPPTRVTVKPPHQTHVFIIALHHGCTALPVFGVGCLR